MALSPGVRALVRLHRPALELALESSPGVGALLRLHGPASAPRWWRPAQQHTCLPRGLCTAVFPQETTPADTPENVALVASLNLLGVDVDMVRLRQPGVLRKRFTHEQDLAHFLDGKGVSGAHIASIISRFPRAITRHYDHLERRWALWRTVFKTDREVARIVARSPESFFRTSDNDNLEKNIHFLKSLDLSEEQLHQLLSTAPRAFSNRVELNMQMVEFLEGVCSELGGEEPRRFALAVISQNPYVLIQSITRVSTNIDTLKDRLSLSDSDLLALLRGNVAEVLDFSNLSFRKNLIGLQEKLVSLGCTESQIRAVVDAHPMLLFFGAAKLNPKLDRLLEAGVTVEQILEKPKVLEYSAENLTQRIKELKRLRYDFKAKGIGIFDCSRKRFEERVERLAAKI